MKKQDRQGVRTPAALERKYKFSKNFTEAKQSASDSQKAAVNAQKSATEAANAAASKVDKKDNAQVVKMINEAVDVLNLRANRLSVESTNFKLSPDGTLEATNAKIKSKVTNSSVEIGDGKVHIEAPATEAVNMDDTTSKALLMTFKVYDLGSTTKYKVYGVYAYGEWWQGDDGGFYWHSLGSISVEEITEGE
jgi:hypothetical protein